jgi:uncharacterized protein (TIGR02444 family)
MLLFCAWLGASRNVILSAEQLGLFEDVARRWQEGVVKSLRHAREAVKEASDIRQAEIGALREQVLAVELEAERIEQALLYRAALNVAGSVSESADAAIRQNVKMFLQSKARAGRADPALPAALIAAAAKMGNC